MQTLAYILEWLIPVIFIIAVVVIITSCTQHVKVFECKLDCKDSSSLECKTAVSGSEVDFK